MRIEIQWLRLPPSLRNRADCQHHCVGPRQVHRELYDVAEHAIVRLLWVLAKELRQHRIAAVALAPGFMRTERVMSHAKGEADWKKVPWLKQSESPEYLGRAVAALAGDPGLMRKSGKAFHVGELAREYGFTDIDGRRVPPFIHSGVIREYGQEVPEAGQ